MSSPITSSKVIVMLIVGATFALFFSQSIVVEAMSASSEGDEKLGKGFAFDSPGIIAQRQELLMRNLRFSEGREKRNARARKICCQFCEFSSCRAFLGRSKRDFYFCLVCHRDKWCNVSIFGRSSC